ILLSNSVGFFAGIAMFLMFVGIVARAEAAPPVGLGKTPLEFGYYSLPTTVVNMIAAPFIGRSISRTGPKVPMLLGGALVVLGGLFLAFNNSTPLDLILGPIPIMTGIIMIFIAMINVIVLSSKPQDTGVQTGMNLTFRNLGTSIGPVAGSTILASVLATYTVTEVVPGVGPVPVHFQAPGAAAFQMIFLLIAAIGTIAFLLALPLRNFRFLADGTRVGGPSEAPAMRGASAPPELSR
ncbi:MAG TPA: hypothetical protein VLY85_00870, partial [Thermoplasmata archaeon]|nr:hypothetical protein [Thermoplasmata archaeon]